MSDMTPPTGPSNEPTGAYPGAVPPPPPAGPPPAPAGTPAPFSIGAAFTYGWEKFQANMGPLIGVAAAAFGALFVINMIGALVRAGFEVAAAAAGSSSNPNGLLLLLGYLIAFVVSIVGWLAYYVIFAGVVRVILDVSSGQPVDIGKVFKFDYMMPAIIAGLIISVASTIGFLLCIIPGIAVLLFTMFTYFFIVDKNMPAVDAIKASLDMVKQNVGPIALFYLATFGVMLVGVMLCYVGILFAAPITWLATAYVYRTLQGETVV